MTACARWVNIQQWCYTINVNYDEAAANRLQLIQYNTTCLESSNKSIDRIFMGWLNQGMRVIMLKLLNFKGLLGFRKHGIHLLMVFIKIRFFRNQGKHQYTKVYWYQNFNGKIGSNLGYLLTKGLMIFQNLKCVIFCIAISIPLLMVRSHLIIKGVYCQ